MKLTLGVALRRSRGLRYGRTARIERSEARDIGPSDGATELPFQRSLLTTHFPQVRAGSYKLYAVAGETRSALVPDTPTLAQMGLPALIYQNWYGLFAPRGTSKDIVSKLNLAAVEALADPAARSQLAELGYEAFPRERQTPETLGALQKADAEKWWPIIKGLDPKAQ